MNGLVSSARAEEFTSICTFTNIRDILQGGQCRKQKVFRLFSRFVQTQMTHSGLKRKRKKKKSNAIPSVQAGKDETDVTPS